MAEYRVSPTTGNMFTREEFFATYKDVFSQSNEDLIQEWWDTLIPVEIPEGVSLEALQEKFRFIYKQPSSFIYPSDSLLVRDPSRILKLTMKPPKP